MTLGEIFVQLAANDLRAIRPIIEYLTGQSDASELASIAAEQVALRQQLEAMLNAAAD